MAEKFNHDDFRIALYYHYINIADCKHHASFQKDLCIQLNLNGRIRVSPEGLNGVLSGPLISLQEYQSKVEADLDVTLDIKYCLLRTDLSLESQLFHDLSVKVTREIVSLYKSTNRPNVSSNYSSYDTPISPDDPRLVSLEPSPHLTPHEWNQRLQKETSDTAILVDARNVYESRVGYFHVEGIPTLLTNTRSYALLPDVLAASQDQLTGKNIYMYCTGGVRCERASVWLQTLLPASQCRIYQLDGGIQRYLEQFGTRETTINDATTISTDTPSSIQTKDNEECLFRGKNFVFDPRRTDPMVGKQIVGQCFVCRTSHDDYDNGKPPCQGNEPRCCKCRVLVLVCDICRETVNLGGHPEDKTKPNLYCGGDICKDEGNSVDFKILPLTWQTKACCELSKSNC